MNVMIHDSDILIDNYNRAFGFRMIFYKPNRIGVFDLAVPWAAQGDHRRDRKFKDSGVPDYERTMAAIEKARQDYSDAYQAADDARRKFRDLRESEPDNVSEEQLRKLKAAGTDADIARDKASRLEDAYSRLNQHLTEVSFDYDAHYNDAQFPLNRAASLYNILLIYETELSDYLRCIGPGEACYWERYNVTIPVTKLAFANVDDLSKAIRYSFPEIDSQMLTRDESSLDKIGALLDAMTPLLDIRKDFTIDMPASFDRVERRPFNYNGQSYDWYELRRLAASPDYYGFFKRGTP